ncbi:MAG: M48 family metallopeptidase [Candidatus Tectomicrobia bacterium]|nr:M48 family metallopeptidase [Candidatus Tectomicrobia bacterium]
MLIRNQQKRWASCDRKGHIRFNWRIVMAPISLVDYIVAHELCHLVRHDHSPAFWKLVRTLLPDYEERRERLKREGPRFWF